MSIEKFYQQYERNGFNFSRKLITRYCLSLYTKPFVILSGVSGTGKTKIAQLFTIFDDPEIKLPNNEGISSDSLISVSASSAGQGYLIMNVTEGVRDGDGRGNFKFKDLESVFEPEEIPYIKSRIDDLQKQKNEGNIIEPSEFTIETNDGRFTAAAYLQRASSPLLRVRFCSIRGAKNEYDSRPFLQKHFKINDKLRLEKIGVKLFKVVSVNEQQVIELDQNLQILEDKLVDNKLFVPVKSNWTDSSEVFGYYNLLDEKYQITNVLKFIMTAIEHPGKPFFLILDEMNLSKVEHYFSDFLSCIESRYLNDGILKQEGIHLHNFSTYVSSNDIYFDAIPSQIYLPMNLYVTGTVNIDETTYMFSPKVLDRANVIEFNQVDLSSYNIIDFEAADSGPMLVQEPELQSLQSNDYQRLDESKAPQIKDVLAQTKQIPFVLQKFPKFGCSEIPSKQAYIDTDPNFKSVVKALLEVLQPYNLHFGYRVINEMSMFINNVCKYVGDSPEIIQQAIDVQISQKVLPKFSGSYGKLDEPLKKLLILFIGKDDIKLEKLDIEYLKTLDVLKTKYPISIAKLIVMYKALQYNGFTSYLD